MNVITIVDENNDSQTLNRENLEQLKKKSSFKQSDVKDKLSEEIIKTVVKDEQINNHHVKVLIFITL